MSFWNYVANSVSVAPLLLETFEGVPARTSIGSPGDGNFMVSGGDNFWLGLHGTDTPVSASISRSGNHVTQGSFSWRMFAQGALDAYMNAYTATSAGATGDIPEDVKTFDLTLYKSVKIDMRVSVMQSAIGSPETGINVYCNASTFDLVGRQVVTGPGTYTLSVNIESALNKAAIIPEIIMQSGAVGASVVIYVDNLRAEA